MIRRKRLRVASRGKKSVWGSGPDEQGGWADEIRIESTRVRIGLDGVSAESGGCRCRRGRRRINRCGARSRRRRGFRAGCRRRDGTPVRGRRWLRGSAAIRIGPVRGSGRIRRGSRRFNRHCHSPVGRNFRGRRCGCCRFGRSLAAGLSHRTICLNPLFGRDSECRHRVRTARVR